MVGVFFCSKSEGPAQFAGRFVLSVTVGCHQKRDKLPE